MRQWTDALAGGASWASREPAAMRLAEWLDWTDAIALAAVIDGRPEGPGPVVAPSAAEPPAGARRPLPAPQDLLAQGRTRLHHTVRSTLREALGLAGAERVRGPQPGPAMGAPPVAQRRAAVVTPAGRPDPAALRTAVRQSQRQLESGVAALRASMRARLAEGSAAQRELAAIDAVLEQALLERQRHLLAGAAARLSRLGENGDPLAVERGLMAALAAELELRLQPLQGLAQALQPTESTHT